MPGLWLLWQQQSLRNLLLGLNCPCTFHQCQTASDVACKHMHKSMRVREPTNQCLVCSYVCMFAYMLFVAGSFVKLSFALYYSLCLAHWRWQLAELCALELVSLQRDHSVCKPEFTRTERNNGRKTLSHVITSSLFVENHKPHFILKDLPQTISAKKT